MRWFFGLNFTLQLVTKTKKRHVRRIYEKIRQAFAYTLEVLVAYSFFPKKPTIAAQKTINRQ